MLAKDGLGAGVEHHDAGAGRGLGAVARLDDLGGLRDLVPDVQLPPVQVEILPPDSTRLARRHFRSRVIVLCGQWVIALCGHLCTGLTG